MSEMKPVAWCLMTNKGEIINGVHEEERLAAQYRHRQADDTMTPLYTADQLAEAVAAEREQWSVTVANALNWLKHGRIANARDDLKAAQRRAINEAIRSAAK